MQAGDGSQAVAMSRRTPIDVLIADLVMPNAEGIETIQHFARHFPQVPIVPISGKSAYLALAKNLGAADALDKTRVYQDLLSVVRRTLDSR